MFSSFMPSSTSKSRQASAAAPAPDATSFTSSIFLPTTFRPLVMAAATTIAVPCWSSWKTGIFMRLRSSDSTMKQSGALMSSRLMAPKVGSRLARIFTHLYGCSDVLEVDGAEGGLQARDDLHQLVRVLLIDLDIEDVDVGEFFEEDRLA